MAGRPLLASFVGTMQHAGTTIPLTLTLTLSLTLTLTLSPTLTLTLTLSSNPISKP